jgi:hypothetical protein
MRRADYDHRVGYYQGLTRTYVKRNFKHLLPVGKRAHAQKGIVVRASA